jgi:hypothetical protein
MQQLLCQLLCQLRLGIAARWQLYKIIQQKLTM